MVEKKRILRVFQACSMIWWIVEQQLDACILLGSFHLLTSMLQIPALRPREYAQISKPKKTVQRAYGGSRCGNCVRYEAIASTILHEPSTCSFRTRILIQHVQRPCRPCFPHRGAEDRQEGSQGAGAGFQEEINW